MMRLFEPVTLLAVGLVVDGLTQDSTQVVLPHKQSASRPMPTTHRPTKETL